MTRPGEDIAADGSPVEVYRRLPPNGEAEIVDAVVPIGATVLELGAGAGRVTRRLVALGHPVVAVDESAAMLAALEGLEGVERVQSGIEDLDLGRRFPVVLLGSHLVNSLSPVRDRFLHTARRHAAPGGDVMIEVYPPAVRWEVGRSSLLGEVEVAFEAVRLDPPFVHATVAYTLDSRTWRQPFEAELLGEPALRAVLGGVGLAFDRWLDEKRGWLLARAPA